MPSAFKFLIVATAALVVAACSQKATENAASQDMSVDSNLVDGQLPANAEIETLPPDESSEDTAGELNSGDDKPDVNDLGNSH